MQIFLSSTAFDLLDVRAEIAATLQSLGVKPVLSDDKLSDFRVRHDADSIETCLVNLEACEEVILVLDQRYGPSLGGAGFDNVSATHLDLKQAYSFRLKSQISRRSGPLAALSAAGNFVSMVRHRH